MNIFKLITILLEAILISFLISVPIINLLYKFKITRRIDVDFSTVIDKRRSKAGTPVMGGLMIVISILILNIVFNLNGSTKIPILVFTISALLGGLDDILNIYGMERRNRSLSRVNRLIKVHASKLTRIKLIITYPWQLYKSFFLMLGSHPGKGIQPHEKILINLVAGLLVFIWVFFTAGWREPSMIYFPFGQGIDIGWLMLPFVVLTVMTMTNAVNLADGMDGLSAGMLIPSFLSFMVIAIIQNNENTAIICATAVGALISYLYFNIPPARVQMGDVGSLSLGTLMAAIALEMRVPFLLLIIGFPFVIELMSSLIQAIARRVIGQRIFMMAPLHHHFELLGWKEEKVVMRFWLLSIFCAVLGIWLYLLY